MSFGFQLVWPRLKTTIVYSVAEFEQFDESPEFSSPMWHSRPLNVCNLHILR